MTQRTDLAHEIARAVGEAPDASVPTLRKLRRGISKELEDRSGAEVLDLARTLLASSGDVPRWFVYELVHHHGPAMSNLDARTLEDLGRGLASWGEVDPFATYLSGVAWREGRISDDHVHRWAASEDRWWRRAAAVSTVPLNVEARGGTGDAFRTLAVCDLLKTDRDDMVVKAVSWALRALAVRDPETVRRYLDEAADELAPRVRREVRNKLETGVKSGGRSTTLERSGRR